jgi:hypothetical protein
LKISAVQRDTRLSTDTLRMWERRYSFPQPMREANSEPVHPVSRVEKLRSIKRLMDREHRPGRIISRRVGEPAARGRCRVEEHLYPDIFKSLERVRWTLETDVPWDSFDGGKLSDEQARTVKMNAITEWSALPATEMFLRDNRQDSDFSAFMSVWFYEEQKHALALIEYLQRFQPDLAPTEQELDAVRFEFDPDPANETLMMHYMKKAVATTGDAARAAFARIGLLMASSARSNKALHPTNLPMNKALFPNDTIQSRLPDPAWLERWLDREIDFDGEWEGKVVNMILHNLSLLFDESIRSLRDLNRYRRELKADV